MIQTPSHQRIAEVRSRVNRACDAIRKGNWICIAEDQAGSDAVWAVMASHDMSADRMNELVGVAGGIIAATVIEEQADDLDLPALRRRRAQANTPQYAVSVEAAQGVSTGISASDRALTVAVLAQPGVTEQDLVRPGHIMPIRIPKLGCLRRPYGPEAAHDLVSLAGLTGGAALSHVITGTEELTTAGAVDFANRAEVPLVYVSDIILLRSLDEELVELLEEGEVAAEDGRFRVQVWRTRHDGACHVALARGDLNSQEAPLVRIHSQCLTGDVLHSHRCDCGAQLHEALRRIEQGGEGVLIYLAQEGRGIGLVGKIKAYGLQDGGMDTVDANIELGYAADQRDYAVAAQILLRLGLGSVRLLTNNPDKVQAMERLGVEIQQRLPLILPSTSHNRVYLATKKARLGHLL